MAINAEKTRIALGPLAELYADPDVLEIMVDTPERVLVERKGRLVDSGVTFSSPESIRSLIDALLALTDQTAQPGETILQILFPGSEARGVAILPPTAAQGPYLVIRKLVNSAAITWEKLIEWGSISQEALNFLRKAVRVPVNILIAGGTGSGKTTVANRIAELIPGEKRLVVVENSHELQVRHPRAVYLEAAAHAGISMQELIRTGSMMRPDWLIIGELYGAEAMRAIEVLGLGYSGMTTIHANSLEDALLRLEAMCLTANMGLGLMEIRNLIAAAIQCVCYQKRLPDGKRKIVEIAEIRGVENGQFVLERLFRYDPEKDDLAATGIRPSWE
jgi:pilus assembly protein CpaF